MFENITFSVLMKTMLEKIPNHLDKREGSVLYNALAPVAIELQNVMKGELKGYPRQRRLQKGNLI